MERYAGKHYSETKKDSKFLTRFASQIESKESFKGINSKDDFTKSYKTGRMAYAVAQKYMNIKTCGLDRYIEEGTNIVWAREGDNIIRLDNDLDWVDTFLKQEGIS